MPIAFDPPASAPHGTLPNRATRTADEDAGAPDIFTQLLLAAAGVQDTAQADAPVAPRKDPRAAEPTPNDAPLLLMPLPVAPALTAATPGAVTIVATEKRTAANAPPTQPLPIPRAAAPEVVPVLPAPITRDGASPGERLGDMLRAATYPDRTPIAADTPASTANAPVDAVKPRPEAPAAPSTASLLAVLEAASGADKASSAKSLSDRAANVEGAAPAPTQQPQSSAPPRVETVIAPAFTPGWQDETVAKLAHIVVSRNERAELKLNPAELGPVSIRVDMKADHATLTIVAASPDTRSALEQSLPQLRDLLAAQGITLGQASVHDGSAQRDALPQPWTAAPSADARAAAVSEPLPRLVRRIGLVDVFA